MDLIFELGIIFLLAALIAYLSKLFKQPILPAYILAGVILALTTTVGESGIVPTMSELGIAFLLFIVGMEIDFNRLKDIGFISTIGGTVLSVSLFFIGLFTAGSLGLPILESVYIGLVIAFSSTMVVVKLLDDKNQLDTLHGRIVLGILLMQDIFAIIALFVLSSLDTFSFINLGMSLGIMVGIGIATFIASRYILPEVFKYAARSEELLFITSIAMCLLFIGAFHYLHLSIAIGAFIAGIALGNLPYNLEIISLVKPIRDFFAVVFFVALGIQLNLGAINSAVVMIIVLLLMTIILKPLLILIMVSYFGYKEKPAFLTALSLAQASEFSLILFVMGLSLGHITDKLFSSVILVTITTMALTPYLMKYEKGIYRILSKHMRFIKAVGEQGKLEYVPKKVKKDVILIGYDRLAYNIFKTLKKLKHKFLVVDYNPEVIKKLINKKIPCIYGDIGDLEIINRLDLKETKMIISTIPDKEDNLTLIKKAKDLNKDVLMIVTASHVEDALDMYKAGAHYVILPHFLGGERVSLLLEEVSGDVKKLLNHKLIHLRELKERKKLKHKHPKRKRHR
ncbi:hypothetical protein GF336_06135 [Candidatus Woesearchaeota archaeon]|nr:hypothetical protein [Candidatus Woesearchaeota archaeon]